MMKPNTWGWVRVVAVFAIAGILILCNAWMPERYAWTIGISLALWIAFGVAEFRFWRCPSCGRYLSRGMRVQFCHHCGHELG